MIRPVVAVASIGAIAAISLSGDRPDFSTTHPEKIDADFVPPIDQYVSEFVPPIEYVSAAVDNSASNLVAFLSLLREGESSNNYFALVGGGNFNDFSDHPAVKGSFKGIRRADGRLTTAAGAYQITRTTWLDLGGVKKYGNFSPSAQDTAAIDLIKRRGAWGAVISGNIQVAVGKLTTEWEFFRKWNSDRVAVAFTKHGGDIA